MTQQNQREKVSSKKIRRKRDLVIILVVLLSVLLLILLQVFITAFEKQLPTTKNILILSLTYVNVILLLLLIFLVVRNVVKLLFERKRGILGAKLRTKLVIAFVGRINAN